MTPIRQCVVCRGRHPKTELLRIAESDGSGGISLMPAGQYRPGRSRYLCRPCLERARTRGLSCGNSRLTPGAVEEIVGGLETNASGEAECEPGARPSDAEGHALSLLGLALRANRVRMGRDETLKTIRAGKAALVVLASDAGKDLRGAVETTLRDATGLESIPGPSKQEIGRALGRRSVGVLAVTDTGFARSIRDRFFAGGASEIGGTS
ncbi:MAG: hypothetical protein CME06_12940 [Gemmatimonadetes bacterium]|nr:hypothetical protein [Gemmatimonadota bacterium]